MGKWGWDLLLWLAALQERILLLGRKEESRGPATIKLLYLLFLLKLLLKMLQLLQSYSFFFLRCNGLFVVSRMIHTSVASVSGSIILYLIKSTLMRTLTYNRVLQAFVVSSLVIRTRVCSFVLPLMTLFIKFCLFRLRFQEELMLNTT